MSAGAAGCSWSAVASGGCGPGLFRSGRMPARRSGCLHACAAASASADFGRWWPRRRLGWRLGRRFRRRPRFRRGWLLRRLLRRRRFVLWRCFGGEHHHHRRRRSGHDRWQHQHKQWWKQRHCHRHRHRQFDLHDFLFGPDQFVHRPGFDVDLDRSGVEQHRRSVEHEHLGQCLVLDRSGLVFWQCFLLDRRRILVRQRVVFDRRGVEFDWRRLQLVG